MSNKTNRHFAAQFGESYYNTYPQRSYQKNYTDPKRRETSDSQRAVRLKADTSLPM